MKHEGFTLWLTGMSGAGKSTLSERLMTRFREGGARAELLDGDEVRAALSPSLGFTRADRDTHIRRLGFVSRLLTRNGVISVVAAISPYRETRDEVRRGIPRFVEVFVDCPIEVLTSRDVKGLYKRALAGELKNFTGVSDPYEPPVQADVVIHSDRDSIEESIDRIWRELIRKGLVEG
ncbi:MAG TPA: adenylyl-sulfate kinase [Bryobacteraceae bacterium]|jgi:adenylyl-sulfate kinase|nr:adenylyl-sulfate kinase [Bryobacteraceae bacterium]